MFGKIPPFPPLPKGGLARGDGVASPQGEGGFRQVEGMGELHHGSGDAVGRNELSAVPATESVLCNLCASDDAEPIARHNGFRVVRCRRWP